MPVRRGALPPIGRPLSQEESHGAHRSRAWARQRKWRRSNRPDGESSGTNRFQSRVLRRTLRSRRIASGRSGAHDVSRAVGESVDGEGSRRRNYEPRVCRGAWLGARVILSGLATDPDKRHASDGRFAPGALDRIRGAQRSSARNYRVGARGRHRRCGSRRAFLLRPKAGRPSAATPATIASPRKCEGPVVRGQWSNKRSRRRSTARRRGVSRAPDAARPLVDVPLGERLGGYIDACFRATLVPCRAIRSICADLRRQLPWTGKLDRRRKRGFAAGSPPGGNGFAVESKRRSCGLQSMPAVAPCARMSRTEAAVQRPRTEAIPKSRSLGGPRSRTRGRGACRAPGRVTRSHFEGTAKAEAWFFGQAWGRATLFFFRATAR